VASALYVPKTPCTPFDVAARRFETHQRAWMWQNSLAEYIKGLSAYPLLPVIIHHHIELTEKHDTCTLGRLSRFLKTPCAQTAMCCCRSRFPKYLNYTIPQGAYEWWRDCSKAFKSGAIISHGSYYPDGRVLRGDGDGDEDRLMTP